MKKRPNRTELIKLLIEERNHHFSHPNQIANKFFYSLIGSIIALFYTILSYFDTIREIKQDLTDYGNVFIALILIMIITLGFLLIILVMIEHTNLHHNQKKRIESAIEYLLSKKNMILIYSGKNINPQNLNV